MHQFQPANRLYVNHEIITKKPKTKTSIRDIVLPAAVMNMLKQYRTEQLRRILSLGDQWEGETNRNKLDDNFLFTQWNGKQMHPSTPYHKFKDILKYYNNSVTDESQKLPDIPLHGLRHTSATLLISQNVDVRTVSSRLGHAQTSTTMNIYAHSLKKMDEKAADALESLMIHKQA